MGLRLSVSSVAMLLGVLFAVLAGLSTGSAAWSFKSIRRLAFENWLFVAPIVMLLVVPWGIVFAYYPDPIRAIESIGWEVILKANLFSFGWGFANVLCAIGFVRIGVALTNGILGSLGITLGVTLPMVFKGSGMFQNAPNLFSTAGIILLIGIVVMLSGVVLATLAGAARDKAAPRQDPKHFWTSILLVAIGGALSVGPSLVIAYSQDSIQRAFRAQREGDIPATMAVWAIGLVAGALVNIVYSSILTTRNGTWKRLITGWSELIVPVAGGCQCMFGLALFSQGSTMMGALGASVGAGVYQGMQILGGQMIGFVTGEWRGSNTRPRNMMFGAIGLLIAASAVMAFGNWVGRR